MSYIGYRDRLNTIYFVRIIEIKHFYSIMNTMCNFIVDFNSYNLS